MAKDKSTETTAADAEVEARDRARSEEEAKQAAVVQAVYDVTHDESGEPIPIVPPEPEAEA